MGVFWETIDHSQDDAFPMNLSQCLHKVKCDLSKWMKEPLVVETSRLDAGVLSYCVDMLHKLWRSVISKKKALTKSRTTARSLSITKSLRRGCSVFCIPSWLFVCASLSIDWRRADEARTKTHFPWRKSPPCTVQSAAWIVVMLSRSFCSSPLLSNSARSSSKSWNVGEEIAARICSG